MTTVCRLCRASERAFSSAAIAAAATVRECWRSTPVSRLLPVFRLPATPIPGRSATTDIIISCSVDNCVASDVRPRAEHKLKGYISRSGQAHRRTQCMTISRSTVCRDSSVLRPCKRANMCPISTPSIIIRYHVVSARSSL